MARKARVEFYRMPSGRWLWRLVAPNGRNVCRPSSFRGWASKSGAMRNFKTSQAYIATADHVVL